MYKSERIYYEYYVSECFVGYVSVRSFVFACVQICEHANTLASERMITNIHVSVLV